MEITELVQETCNWINLVTWNLYLHLENDKGYYKSEIKMNLIMFKYVFFVNLDYQSTCHYLFSFSYITKTYLFSVYYINEFYSELNQKTYIEV